MRSHAQAAAELAVDAEPAEHRGDLRAAAVDDDRAQTGRSQEDDVLREGPLELVVDHGMAAVLENDDGAGEPAEPGQGLHEDRRLLRRRELGPPGVTDWGTARAVMAGSAVMSRSCRVGAVLVDVGMVRSFVHTVAVASPGMQVDQDVHLPRDEVHRARSSPGRRAADLDAVDGHVEQERVEGGDV